MSPDDRIAQGIETGPDDAVSPAEQDLIDAIRGALRSDFVWEEPPAGLKEQITSQIAPKPTRSRRWLWEVAAAIALIVGTVGVLNLTTSERASPVAVVAMAGTQLEPSAVGSAALIPTPNGWAISFEAKGLPPAQPGTYYEAWVNNGQNGVAVGTFHMRGGQPTPLALWSGVDLEEYRTINITLQQVGGGPDPSGVVVMTGTATEFSDE